MKIIPPSLLSLPLIMVACAGSLAAQAETVVTVHPDTVLFRLSDESLGANMEDLNYQMVGGFDSQLIHGESFMEPSPTELAQVTGRVEGFTSVAGTWLALPDGRVRVDVRGGKIEDVGEVPADAGVAADDKKTGARLISHSLAPAGTVETSADFWFPAGSQSSAGLILHVHPNHADNGWEWYSGYTLNLQPKEQQIALTRADRANKHKSLATAPVEIKTGEWTSITVRVDGGKISAQVNGKTVLAVDEPRPLPTGHLGLVTRGNAMFRNLTTKTASGAATGGPFQTSALTRQPGDDLSLRWAKVQTGGATGSFQLLTPGDGTWLKESRSQKIVFTGGQGEFGMDNAGLTRWGLALRQGKDYKGFLRVKTAAPTNFTVSLRSADGQTVHSAQTLKTSGQGEYEKIGFTLTANKSDANGRFAVTLAQPGEITVGYAFLEPGDWGLFKGLPIRGDLAEALIAQGVKLLRLNGGMIEVDGYRWASMQGPRDQRPPFNGFYDRYCSSGYGPIEHLRFCEAAGFIPLIGLNVEETPEAVADFVAYATAAADTPAGRRRADDGHPAPFNMPYYQVANESRFNEAYVEKFKQVAEAVWKVAPDITLITTSAAGYSGENEAEAREKLALHLDLVNFCQERGKKLVIDCHDFSGAAKVPGIARFGKWIKQFSAKPEDVSVAILEFNAGAFDFQRGLSHALEINAAHRFGDVIRGTGTPNLSQPWNVYQTDWKAVLWTQGNIYYTQDKLWVQPAYLVDRMISQPWASDVVRTEVASPEKAFDVLAAKTADGSRLMLRVVNPTSQGIAARLEIPGWDSPRTEITVETLACDNLEAFNTLEQPDKIRVERSPWPSDGQPRIHTFPANSFTTLLLRTPAAKQE